MAAECYRPVMLYSIGKDSAVMLHLARSWCFTWHARPFVPLRLPFPLLHVDTRWKFRQMIEFRVHRMAKTLGFELLVHINPDGIARQDYSDT